MKKLLLFFFLVLSLFGSHAQPFGNEWIDPSRAYYKISVSADGIYRIPYNVLSNAIPNFSNLNPTTLVLYHNGEAVPIYVSTNSANWGVNDYIEFYGKKNRGEMDAQLYKDPSYQGNPTYSLFTDVAIYYLTTNNLPNNPRLTFTPNVLAGLPPKEEYFMYLYQVNYPNGMYYPGKYYSVGQTETYKSIYDEGEGYTCSPYFGNGAQNFTAATPYIYTQGPAAIFKSIYCNNSYENHSVKILLNSGLTPLYSQSNFGFKMYHVQLNIPVTQLIDGNNTISYTDDGNGVSSKKNTVGTVSIEYPRQFNFDNQTKFAFQIDASSASKYLEIVNFNNDNTQPLLYDLTNGLIYRSNELPGSAIQKFKLNPSSVKREMYLRADNSANFTSVSQLTPINFTNYSAPENQAAYFIIANSALFDDGNTNWVEEYRQYREGKFAQSKIANIDLLYDQFGYGIRKSPLAIRNFIRYMSQSTDVAIKMQYCFLVGKGREAPDLRSGSGAAYNQCLVPTFGYPGSDNLLAATQSSDVPLVAIGRLAAQTPQQVHDYLDKMKEYERNQSSITWSCGPPAWQKEVLHFSGGTTPQEQFLFSFYVQNYKRTIEDSLWGAHVTTFSKTTNDPISVTQSEAIREKINEGVSWITFFGHSATGAFDFSIDEPENYTNAGKYPIMLSNGCFSGFIHDANPGYSERFVLEGGKGTIAFMATSSLSVSSGLNNFTTQLYRNLAVNKYHQNLGIAFKQTLTDLFTQTTPVIDDYTSEIAYEMTLHGDPGLMPNQYPKPDYAVTAVYTTPLTITPGTDNFDVNVVVKNNGMVSVDDTAGNIKVNSKFDIKLTRTIFDGSNNPVYYYYTKRVYAPYLADTFSFTLPVSISTLGYGQNLFQVEIDANHEIEEIAECNNTLDAPVSAYIQNDDVLPIYPYEFAIVPQKGVTLKASTINPFAPLREYIIQIDTSELFASPLAQTVINQVGGVLHWKTDDALYRDSVVYYWRVKKNTDSAEWHYSSFIYLKDEYPGWNQSHYFQHKKDAYQTLSLDNDRVFRFPPSTNQIHVRTGKANAVGGNVDYETLGWDYNNYNEYRYRMGGCGYGSGGITFAVIDPISGQPWISHNNDGDNFGDEYGNVHCNNKGDQPGFDFPTTGVTTNTHFPANTGWDVVIQNFLNAIPPNFFVLAYTVNNPPYTGWSTTLQNSLGSIGLVTQPYTSGGFNGQIVFFNQKGNINYNPFLATTNGLASILDTSFTFTGSWYQGTLISTKIGPAVEWGSVHWLPESFQGLNTDKDTLDIIGIQANGLETVLQSTALADNILDQGLFDAHTYPYMRLRMRTSDQTTRTPTQLQYWRVLYKKPPEGAINPAAVQVINMTNPVNQGANFHLEIPFENVTEVDMSALLTKYVLRDANLNNINFNIRYDALPGLQTLSLVVDYPITSNNYLGVNKIIIEANPDNDQLEQYHFNNIAELSFSAVGDKINPLLDVTYDNQHILSGDIISAKPNIVITLKDENKYLALDDQSLIDVYIRYPGAAEPTKMLYDNVIMKFYPADPANLAHSNKAQVELKPEFNVDGTYELLIKNRDRSGNNSATTDALYQGNNPPTFFDYKMSFEVITKAMITNVLNYPNPFTTATHFVFTLTGSEVPDNMKIQIVTIKGTVVKEIFKDELGPIHIGRNITEYAWDGRDQYGDLLANGIYFYHVITRLDDKRMDQMSTTYDKYFKKGFGKMAIVR